LTPTGPIDAAIFEKREPKLALRKMLYMAYPYFYLYRAMILGQWQSAGCNWPSNLGGTPVLYMYGTEKNIQFHDDNHLVWLKKEAAKKDSKTRVVAVDKAGHWLYLQQPDTCYENVKSFIFESWSNIITVIPLLLTIIIKEYFKKFPRVLPTLYPRANLAGSYRRPNRNLFIV